MKDEVFKELYRRLSVKAESDLALEIEGEEHSEEKFVILQNFNVLDEANKIGINLLKRPGVEEARSNHRRIITHLLETGLLKRKSVQ